MMFNESFENQIKDLMEAKDTARLVFWNRPLREILLDASMFLIAGFAAELHPTFRIVEEADLEDLAMILEGESKLTVNGKDYWGGVTSSMIKYMIRIREGEKMRLVERDGKHISGYRGLGWGSDAIFTFTMDFKGRLRADSPWAVRVYIKGIEQRKVF